MTPKPVGDIPIESGRVVRRNADQLLGRHSRRLLHGPVPEAEFDRHVKEVLA